MIFIGLGSSIGDAIMTFARVEDEFEKLNIKIVQKSSVLVNEPYGGAAQNVFSNAVWQIETDLEPLELLRALLSVENKLGRTREVRWGDRTIDLDLLMYNDTVCDTSELELPHPEISKRIFVLEPWSELVDKSFKIPTLGTIDTLLSRLKK